MSKELEREYQALVNSEVPDLWARIEAGLEEKKTALSIDETDFPVKDPQTENVRHKKVRYKIWAGLAAACVCVALIIPAMTRTMMGGRSSNSAPNFTTAQESYVTSEGISAGAGSDADNMDNAGMAEAAEEETDCFEATVEILEIDVRMESEILYTAKVIGSENPDLSSDSRIKIIGSAVFEKNQIYDLTLREDHSVSVSQAMMYILVDDAEK